MTAYEKMLEDGTAFKKINISQPTPDNPDGNAFGGGFDDNPKQRESLFEQHMDRSMDDVIEQAKAMKEAREGRPTASVPRVPVAPPPSALKSKPASNGKIKELERRVSMLEQALQLVMETQTKLLKENG